MQGYQRDEHLLHADSSMLEGILVILYVVIIIVGIGKEIIACGKDVGGAQVGTGQSGFVRVTYLKHFLLVVGKALAQLVAQVGVCVLVSHHLDRDA